VKLRVTVTVIAALAAALLYATTAGAPNRPPPESCPAGYERDSNSTDRQLLCTRTVTRDVVREVRVEVPGPERIVPGPERIVERLVEVRVEVPGPERIVPGPVRWKTKRVPGPVQWKTKFKTHTVFKKYCPKKPNELAG
jgi:hypothetical protein